MRIFWQYTAIIRKEAL
ncbi:DUF2538 family protein [Staphylococcus aureus]